MEPNFFVGEDIPDIITCFKFNDDRLRGLASAEGQILPFFIEFDGRPYNTFTLPCELWSFAFVLLLEIFLFTSWPQTYREFHLHRPRKAN